jgi:hypothetical protein
MSCSYDDDDVGDGSDLRLRRPESSRSPARTDETGTDGNGSGSGESNGQIFARDGKGHNSLRAKFLVWL